MAMIRWNSEGVVALELVVGKTLRIEAMNLARMGGLTSMQGAFGSW